MVVFRATQKLRRRMGAATSEVAVPTSNGHLGDWYANAVSIRRQHVVLAVSGVTLLPVLLHAAPYQTILPRFVEAMGQVLRALNDRFCEHARRKGCSKRHHRDGRHHLGRHDLIIMALAHSTVPQSVAAPPG